MRPGSDDADPTRPTRSRRGGSRAGILRRVAACVLIALALTAVTAILAPAGWFERLDGVLSDLAFPRGAPDPAVAVVGIDQRSLAEVDPTWPWSRDLLARMVRQLGDAGAEVIAVDLVLAGASPGDDALAGELARWPTVLATASGTASSEPGRPIQVGPGVAPSAPLADAASAVGHAQVLADPADGIVRSVPVVVETSDRRVVPALSLAAFALSEGVDPAPILRRPSGVQVGDSLVPTDDRYRMRISWPDGLPPTADAVGPVIGASDVLAGSFDPADVEGRVVFIGVTDPTLGDQIATPVTKRTPDPGVMVQASAFHTMASRQFLLGPSTAETLMWVALLALLTALAVQFLPLPLAGLSAVAVLAASLVVPVARFSSGTALHSVYPAAAVALAIPLSGGVRYLAETRMRRRVSTLFGRYVPPTVAKELEAHGQLSKLFSGTTVTATVLFCDIRAFTPITADLDASQIRQLLDTYYDELAAVVLEHGGSVLRYTGDEILAAFGAPLDEPDHARRAVECATAMQARQEQLHERLRRVGLPTFGYGIGIETGEVVSTVVGSDARQQYAVIGPALTLGSRLCGEAGAGEIVVSEQTWEASGEDRPEATDERVRVKGRSDELHVHRIGDHRNR